MRALGIDLGRSRVGVAISDSEGALALPYEVLDRKGGPVAARLAEIVADEGIAVVVVGLPLSLSGADGPAARAVREEAAALARVLPVPLEVHDERLTTVEAERPLVELEMRAEARRRVVDKVAAAVMLQSWLDARRARRG